MKHFLEGLKAGFGYGLLIGALGWLIALGLYVMVAL